MVQQNYFVGANKHIVNAMLMFVRINKTFSIPKLLPFNSNNLRICILVSFQVSVFFPSIMEFLWVYVFIGQLQNGKPFVQVQYIHTNLLNCPTFTVPEVTDEMIFSFRLFFTILRCIYIKCNWNWISQIIMCGSQTPPNCEFIMRFSAIYRWLPFYRIINLQTFCKWISS